MGVWQREKPAESLRGVSSPFRCFRIALAPFFDGKAVIARFGGGLENLMDSRENSTKGKKREKPFHMRCRHAVEVEVLVNRKMSGLVLRCCNMVSMGGVLPCLLIMHY
jgi:hypothetical protein